MNKQLINEVSQSSYKCAETSELNLFHGQTCVQQSNFKANMRFEQIRPNLTRGYSQTDICADYVWNKEEKYGILWFEAGSSRRNDFLHDLKKKKLCAIIMQH